MKYKITWMHKGKDYMQKTNNTAKACERLISLRRRSIEATVRDSDNNEIGGTWENEGKWTWTLDTTGAE